MAHQESDDSSVEEQYDDEGQGGAKGNKPWVPAIEDPNYFEDLSPEEIYDSFFTIRRMGFIANRIIRKLNETKHIVSSKILEKRKKLKAIQRKQFEQLSPAGVEYLKVLLKMGKN
jgi:DNA polymerase III alpha subunit